MSTDGKTGDGAADCCSPVSPVPGRVLREHQSVSFAQLTPLATAARGRPSYATVEPLLERLYPRTFEWSRLAADGSIITKTAPLFGGLIEAVKWYADHEGKARGEPPDFAPGTNARRRALKAPPTKHAAPSGAAKGLLSLMSFRTTRSAEARSLVPSRTSSSAGSTGSSRKSVRLG